MDMTTNTIPANLAAYIMDETPAQTISRCGIRDLRSVPKCPYCGHLLTSNEYDHETGYFYSAHSICQYETGRSLGRFEVVTTRSDHPEAGETVRYYTNRKRAVEAAQQIRRDNRREWACGEHLEIAVRERLSA